jgi:antitoxin (DNA-binding transcriptional repressor) of toxin-antitoxin stability system
MEDYTKINLREFRQNLSQVKDSLASGQAYELMERGVSLGYLVPVKGFKITEEKKKKMTQEEWVEFVHSLIGCAELKDEIKDVDDYMEGYRILLEKKYLKK